MTGDLFPVAMISFRSVASLLLEPLMNVCWRQIFAILFCLKRNNWRLSKASTSWFDILGYFTIFSSIQTYGIQLYTKNIQSNCCTEEGLALRLWSSGNSVPIPLTTPSLMFRLWSIVKTRLSESEAWAEEPNQSQSVGTWIVIGLSFRFCFRLRQFGFTRS